jgi:putative ABC transport system permease protein
VKILKLILRNAFRHKLRTLLTLVGIAVAVLAFTLLRTVVGAWYSGVEAAAADRLITRHAVSFVFSLPIAYEPKIRSVPGVTNVSYAVWFQGQYKDPKEFKNFFPRMAIDTEHFFEIYPEFIVPPDQMEAFRKERNACIIGMKTARQHNLKIGDLIPINGDIYPGKWQFVVRGIYHGKDRLTDETQMFFDWRYLDEYMKKSLPYRADRVGWYVVKVDHASDAPGVSDRIDTLFKNSSFETKTETEKAFNQSFISMYSAIITAMNFISFVVVGIILLVLANTMAMTARERTTEYAVLKTLGFTGRHMLELISGESVAISIIGGALGIFGALPVIKGFQLAFPNMFPILPDPRWTILLGMSAAVAVGIIASLFPLLRVSRMRIVDGLRHID